MAMKKNFLLQVSASFSPHPRLVCWSFVFMLFALGNEGGNHAHASPAAGTSTQIRGGFSTTSNSNKLRYDSGGDPKNQPMSHNPKQRHRRLQRRASPSQSPSAPPSQQPSQIELILRQNYALQGGNEFNRENQDSYWVKALRYVEATSDGMPDWRIGQRYSLACIYYATNGVVTAYTEDLFQSTSGFALDWQRAWAGDTYTDSMETTLNIDECTWWGVKCESNGRVEELNLASNLMMGSVPPEIVLLKETLKVLDLENNYVWNDGMDKIWWLGHLTQLEVLNLGKTGFGFQGQGLPPLLSSLTKLKQLSVYSTIFLGPMNETIFESLTELEYLDIGALSFNSTLPLTLKKLEKLQYVYLDNSDFYGSLDDFFDGTGFGSLQEIWMDYNPGLSGGIPASLAALASIESLSLMHCSLSGPVPFELGLLSNMKQMWLSHNKLNSTIPATLGDLGDLTRLYVHDNSLTGVMPWSIGIRTFGLLDHLGADCQSGGPISCPWCSCCGDECDDN